MTNFSRFAVIKTGWCDSYTGDEPSGNFKYFEKGLGAERFNMLPTSDGFKIYCITPAPRPATLAGWTIAHVAIDPADRKMKLVGWYEKASFLGEEIERKGKGEGADSFYCIVADKAFEIPPADRPILVHDRKLGSTRIGWLRGKATATDWSLVASRLELLVEASKSVSLNQRNYRPGDGQKLIGDTVRPAENAAGIDVDDGGVPYGRNPSAESEEHKALKAWACANPTFFGAPSRSQPGQPEFDLPSGDRVDAVHANSSDIWLIEGKSRRSGEKDHERGIYQCVKYRAVYEAMQSGMSEKLSVHVVLLTEKSLSDRLQQLAKRHRITAVRHFCKAL